MSRIVNLVAEEESEVPDVVVNTRRKTSHGLAAANQHLQMKEWAFDYYFAGAIIDEETGKAMEYRDLIKSEKTREIWTKSLANELGRLTKGIRDIPGTETMEFIHKSEIPKDRLKDVTYARIVVSYRPEKVNKPNRTRLTVGGDRINYPFATSSPAAGLTTIKLLWNSVLSTKDTMFANADISNFYLNTPMKRPEYMKIPLKIIPQEIIDKYDLEAIAVDGWVYCKITKGMYGLPHAGLIAYELLKERLGRHGYYECQFTQGLWRHAWRPVTFTLVVDDFGIKYQGKCNAEHLIKTLRKYYKLSVNWKGD